MIVVLMLLFLVLSPQLALAWETPETLNTSLMERKWSYWQYSNERADRFMKSLGATLEGAVGYTKQGRPIRFYTWGVLSSFRLTVVAGQHGNEPVGKFFQEGFLSAVKSDPGFLNSTRLYLVPVANPDGTLLYTNLTSEGLDMNRHWNTQASREVRAIRSRLANTYPLLYWDVFVDIHGYAHKHGTNLSGSAIIFDGAMSESAFCTGVYTHMPGFSCKKEATLPNRARGYYTGLGVPINVVAEPSPDLTPREAYEAGKGFKRFLDYLRGVSNG